MIERRENACFAFKAHQPIRNTGEVLRQDLDRDITPQLRIARAIHLAHPARTEQRVDSIDADLFADQFFRAHPQSRITNPESGSECVSATFGRRFLRADASFIERHLAGAGALLLIAANASGVRSCPMWASGDAT